MLFTRFFENYEMQYTKYQTDNNLHLCTFKTPPSGAVMSERGDADCAFSMCNGVNYEKEFNIISNY